MEGSFFLMYCIYCHFLHLNKLIDIKAPFPIRSDKLKQKDSITVTILKKYIQNNLHYILLKLLSKLYLLWS
jgi:hypothetical protein